MNDGEQCFDQTGRITTGLVLMKEARVGRQIWRAAAGRPENRSIYCQLKSYGPENRRCKSIFYGCWNQIESTLVRQVR